MPRIVVIGPSGCGKTTTARGLAARLQIPHVELAALFHRSNWEPNPDFALAVAAVTAVGHWVVDGNYPSTRDLLWGGADTLVWLDLPRSLATRRAVWRTVRRLLTRVELWNGNRERLRTVLRASHPIRHTWRTAASRRSENERRLRAPKYAHLAVVRLRSPAEVATWLAAL